MYTQQFLFNQFLSAWKVYISYIGENQVKFFCGCVIFVIFDDRTNMLGKLLVLFYFFLFTSEYTFLFGQFIMSCLVQMSGNFSQDFSQLTMLTYFFLVYFSILIMGFIFM